MADRADLPDVRMPRLRRPIGVRPRAPDAGWLASLPNLLTLLRLCLLAPLWTLALLGRPLAVGLLLAVAAATDVLDGFLARRLGLATEFGSRFDSLADHLLTASTCVWLVLLRPAFVAEQRVPLLLWGALAAFTLLVGWRRFRCVGALHLYSAKGAAFLAYCFAIHLLIVGSYHEAVFYVVLGACLLATVETLAAYLTRTDVDEHIGSLLFRRGRAPSRAVAAGRRLGGSR